MGKELPIFKGYYGGPFDADTGKLELKIISSISFS